MSGLKFYPKNFIKATEEFTTFDRAVPAPYIRKSFVCDSACTAVLEIAACGFYEVFVNGKSCGVKVMSPYIFDISSCVSKGKNTPFNGYELKGVVKCTIVDGEMKYLEV